MNIIGHHKQREFLKKSFEMRKIPHAYLFAGPEGLGKKALAIELGKQILGVDISKRQHPDYIFIEPQGKEIQIDQIRDFVWKLSLKPFVSPYKVALIDKAHSMNKEAQNCLLKTLEEPKGETLIILITEYPQLLFPTVLSRCELIKFYPVSNDEIAKYLKGIMVDEKDIEEIVKISMGRPGVALDLALNPLKLEARRKAAADLIKISKASLAVRFQYIKEMLEQVGGIEEILNAWRWSFREAFLLKVMEKKEERAKEPRLGRLALSERSILELEKVLKRIEDTSFLISRTNINLKLALEELVMEF